MYTARKDNKNLEYQEFVRLESRKSTAIIFLSIYACYLGKITHVISVNIYINRDILRERQRRMPQMTSLLIGAKKAKSLVAVLAITSSVANGNGGNIHNVQRAAAALQGGETKRIHANKNIDRVASLTQSPALLPGNVYLQTKKRTSFNKVLWVALANILINTTRPDPSITPEMRLPRVIWEIAIGVVAVLANKNNAVPAIYILLAIMTGSTAMTDLFLWAPLFAGIASFENYTGGGWFSRRPRICHKNYSTGLGRLFVSYQCIIAGLFYLMTSIAAMGSFTSIREEEKVDRQVKAMQRFEQLQRQNQLGV